MRILLIAAIALSLNACTGYEPIGKVSTVNAFTGDLRTQPSLEVTPSIEISAETGAGAAAIGVFGLPKTMLGTAVPAISSTQAAILYIVYDPLAPNWTIKERALNQDTYYFALTAKSFRTGGDGESIQIIKRRALQLQREKGYNSYRILDYSEGIESSTPLTHRVSEGTIQLVNLQGPAKR